MPAKAKAAAKAAPAPALVLTKPTKGATKKAQNRLSIKGFEKIAAAIRERQMKLDSLLALQKEDKETLITAVKVKRLEAEKEGDFHKTVLVESQDKKPVQVVFQDRYSKVDVGHEEALRAALVGNYDSLFTKGVDLKPKKGVTLEKLKEALGDKFGALVELVEYTEFLSPDKDFMTKRSTLRPTLAPAVADAIDQVADQVQVSPSVKVK